MPTVPFFRGVTTSEQPTAMLRWKSGKMQQQWKIIEYVDGEPKPELPALEWREVPTEP